MFGAINVSGLQFSISQAQEGFKPLWCCLLGHGKSLSLATNDEAHHHQRRVVMPIAMAENMRQNRGRMSDAYYSTSSHSRPQPPPAIVNLILKESVKWLAVTTCRLSRLLSQRSHFEFRWPDYLGKSANNGRICDSTMFDGRSERESAHVSRDGSPLLDADPRFDRSVQ